MTLSHHLEFPGLATSGSAQMRGFATGIGSKADIGARPVVTASAWRASAERLDYVARAIRLYEQEPGEALASARLGLYVRQWVRWAGAGLNTRTELAAAIFESTLTAS